MTEEEREELSEEDYETGERTETDLFWTCKNCGKNNAEYNIPYEEEIICECYNCGKEYSVWYCPY